MLRTPLSRLVCICIILCVPLIAEGYTTQELVTFGIWRSNLANLGNPCLTWSNSRLNDSVNGLFGFYVTNAVYEGPFANVSGCYNVSYLCPASMVLSPSSLPVPNSWGANGYYDPSTWGDIIPLTVLTDDPSSPDRRGCELDLVYYPPNPSRNQSLCSSVCDSLLPNPSTTTTTHAPLSTPSTEPPITTTTTLATTTTTTTMEPITTTLPSTTTTIAPPCDQTGSGCNDLRCCARAFECCRRSGDFDTPLRCLQRIAKCLLRCRT